MRLRIKALRLLPAVAFLVAGCSSDAPSPSETNQPVTSKPEKTTSKPGGKTPKKPKELRKLTGPTDLTE